MKIVIVDTKAGYPLNEIEDLPTEFSASFSAKGTKNLSLKECIYLYGLKLGIYTYVRQREVPNENKDSSIVV